MNWILLLVLILLGSLAYASASGAPWVPTWKKDLHRLKKLLNLSPGQTAIELGCGNARVCQYLANECTRVTVHGIELSMIQWFVAKVQSLGTKNVKILFGNVFGHDLSRYDAVYLFLMPETYAKLRPKFEKELKSGARVVTYVWPMPEWTPTQVDHEEGRPDLYLYVRGV